MAAKEYPIIRSDDGKRVHLGDSWMCTKQSSCKRFGQGVVTLLGADYDKNFAIVGYKGKMIQGSLVVTTMHPRWLGMTVGVLPV